MAKDKAPDSAHAYVDDIASQLEIHAHNVKQRAEMGDHLHIAGAMLLASIELRGLRVQVEKLHDELTRAVLKHDREPAAVMEMGAPPAADKPRGRGRPRKAPAGDAPPAALEAAPPPPDATPAAPSAPPAPGVAS